jgi:hypothetical protein
MAAGRNFGLKLLMPSERQQNEVGDIIALTRKFPENICQTNQKM